jgi:hypothetical protein
MEIILALLIVASFAWGVVEFTEGEGANDILAIIIITLLSIALYAVVSSEKTEYICPTRLSETVGVYHNGKETIIIPPHYNLDESVIEKRYNPLPISMQTDRYTITYDLNGVCK